MQYIQNLKPFVILALDGDKDLAEMNFKTVNGKYRGQTETAYLVGLESMDDSKLQTLIDLAQKHNQESILIVDEYREAQLLFLKTGAVEYVGRIQNVSEDEAKASQNYTESDGYYYVAKI